MPKKRKLLALRRRCECVGQCGMHLDQCGTFDTSVALATISELENLELLMCDRCWNCYLFS